MAIRLAAELLGRIATIEERELDLGRAAFETWCQALAADPDYVPALNNLAVLLRGRGGHPRAHQ